MKKLTRQRKWQLKKLAEGKCEICGKTKDTDMVRCSNCKWKVISKDYDDRQMQIMR